MRCRLAGWWFLVLVLLPGAHPESAVDAAGAQTTNETKVDFDRIQRELLDVINAQRARAVRRLSRSMTSPVRLPKPMHKRWHSTTT